MIKPASLRNGESQSDSEIRGLSLRRGNSGRYSWMLHYRTKGGKERRPKIGEYPAIQIADARRIARELLAKVALGDDPAGNWKTERDMPTFAEFWHTYKTKHVKTLRSADSVYSVVNKYLLPAFGKLRIDQIDGDMVQELHRKITRKAPIAANRTVAILSPMMKEAERRGYRPRGSNPCQDVRRNRENTRHRYMTPEEAKAVSEALLLEPAMNRAAIMLLLFTGARRGEIAGRVLNRQGSMLVLGQHKTGHGKFIHLPDVAIELIESQGLDGKVFPLPNTLSQAWIRVCRRAGVQDLHLHDLRHSFASAAISGGVPLAVIGGLLGHSNPAMTQRYAHLVEGTGRAAANAAAAQLKAMLAP